MELKQNPPIDDSSSHTVIIRFKYDVAGDDTS